MASSGLLSTSNQYVKYWIEVSVNSQDIAKNTSNITVKVWAKRTNTGYTTWGSGSVTLKVDGAYYNSGTKDISIGNNNVLLHSWTGNTGHATDGTKTLTVYAAVNIPSILSSSEQAYSETLATIPRTSSFTVNKTSCELGTPFTVTISRASGSFTHSVSYIIGGSERRYLQPWNSTATTCSATPPITDAVYAKYSTSMGITVIVDTYLGSTFVGSASKTITLTIPSSVVPTISSVTATLVDGSWSKYIKGKSKVKLTANGVNGVYGSTITSVTFSGGGYSNTDTTSPWEYITGILNTAGNNTFTAIVTDSRGRTNKATVTITVTDYYSPFFTEAWCVRCLKDGTTDLNGTYIKVLINLNYDKVGGSNTHVVKYRYRVVGGTWSSYASVTNNVATGAIGGGSFSTDLTYEVELYGSDYFTSVTPKIVILQTAVFPIDFLTGNKGVAFGKAAELSDTVDFAYKAKFRKSTVFDESANFEKQIIVDNIGNGTSAGEVWATFRNISGVGRVGLATGVDGDGLRVNIYGKTGSWQGMIEMLYNNILINSQAIIERKSVPNGEYTKFYDGTLICRRTYVYSSFACATQFGSVYYGNSDGWVFPFPFTAEPEIAAFAVSGGSPRYVTITSRTKSAFNSMVSSPVSHNGGFTYTYIAVGRWKD